MPWKEWSIVGSVRVGLVCHIRMKNYEIHVIRNVEAVGGRKLVQELNRAKVGSSVSTWSVVPRAPDGRTAARLCVKGVCQR